MNAKAIHCGALLMVVISGASLQAQGTLYNTYPTAPQAMPAPTGVPLQTGLTPPPSSTGLNPLADAGITTGLPKADGLYAAHWLGGSSHGCCDNEGRHGPIETELYLHTGASLPVAGGFLNNRVQVGWLTQGGGRSLFFNAERDAAWVLDLGVGFIYNNGRADQLPHNQEGNLITVRNLYRTYLNVGLGRDWFMFAPNDLSEGEGANLRYGVDVAGRLGTSHLDANLFGGAPPFDYLRYSDIYGGLALALHANVEVPIGGSWIFSFGVRTEYVYSWVDYVTGPDVQNNLYDVNLLLTTGLRF